MRKEPGAGGDYRPTISTEVDCLQAPAAEPDVAGDETPGVYDKAGEATYGTTNGLKSPTDTVLIISYNIVS